VKSEIRVIARRLVVGSAMASMLGLVVVATSFFWLIAESCGSSVIARRLILH
jgi:hypothetical protein